MKKRILARQIPNDQLKNVCSSPILSRIFNARGVQASGQLDYSLNSLLRPNDLKDIDRALALLIEARQQQSRILIIGDFDADGATSTAVAMRCLRALGFSHVDFLVPNRFEYGYGLTPEIVEVAEQYSPDLIITDDNGISSVDGVAAAKTKNIQVLVTDHHLPGATLPNADAIINPNQPCCDFATKNAAGVGVIFYVMLALRALMQKHGYFDQKPAPNLAEFLDLVALGTVADVVPLDHNNRILVQQGLLRMRAGKACEGIKAIAKVAGRPLESIQAMDLGFMVGPRLNAAGRLDDMTLGIRCLLADDATSALALAAELDALNRERRAIESSMQVDAAKLLENMADAENSAAGICLYQPDWHQGVIGILASRVKDKLHRPAIVFADDDNSGLKGSGRSIKGIHLRDVLDQVATQNPGMLTKFGGHAMAAGLSLDKAHLENFSQEFNRVVCQKVGAEVLTPTIETDGELNLEDLSLELAELIADAGPWGQGFPEPSFHGEFLLVNQRVVGTKHLKLVLALPAAPQQTIDAIHFNADLEQWPASDCSQVFAVYKLQVNEYRERRNLQLMIEYIEPFSSSAKTSSAITNGRIASGAITSSEKASSAIVSSAIVSSKIASSGIISSTKAGNTKAPNAERGAAAAESIA